MGSFFEVRISAMTPGGAGLASRALDRVAELEDRMTVYRDDSELSRLNRAAHLHPVAMSEDLYAVVERAIAIGIATGGVYDVASGSLSAAWGFTRGPKRVPTREDLLEARARAGQGHLTFDAENRCVSFDREGILVNLGSIGKGYAIDEAAGAIRAYPWPTSALIHGGQSSVYALGSPPNDFAGRWRVSLRNPFDPSRPLGTIRLRNRGLGTSGAAFQRFEEGGRLYGHIIDPRTGEPPETGPESVSVLAPTAAEADALSTAFFLMGVARAREFVANRPDLGVIFVLPADAERPPRLVRINVTDDDLRPDPAVRLAPADE